MNHRVLKTPAALAVLSFWFAATQASAWETGMQLGVNYATSDNIERVELGEQSDDIREAVLGLSLDAEEPMYNVDIDYFARGRDYKNDVLEDNNLLAGRTLLTWVPLPRNFSWEVMHLRSDLLNDNALVDTDTNRETRNILSTGPSITFGIGAADSVTLNARYIDISFELTELSDNERIDTSLVWKRELSSVSQFSAFVEHNDIEYRAGEEQSFTKGGIEFRADLREAQYLVRLGTNRAETVQGDSRSDLLVRLVLSYQSDSDRISFLLAKDLVDTSVGFATEGIFVSESFSLADEGTSTNFTEIDVLEQQSVSIGYSSDRICSRCVIRVNAFYDDLDYIEQPRDQDILGINTELTYELNSKLRVNASLLYGKSQFFEEFDTVTRKDDVEGYGAGLEYKLSRNLELSVDVSSNKRESNIPGLNFEELSLRAGILWSLGSSAVSN